MLLIDASNLKSGGGAGLLIHITDVLFKRSMPFVVLHNPALEKYKLKGKLISVNTSLFNRGTILKQYIDDLAPSTVFYFGNYPPTFKDDKVNSFVSFQNLHLLASFDGKGFSLKEKILWKIKQYYLRYNLNNATNYIVPTSYVQEEFMETFSIAKSRVPIIPFYEQQTILNWKAKFEQRDLIKKPNTFIYNSGPHGHKNHINLFKAWEIVLDKGYNPLLKITLPNLDDKRVLKFKEQLDTLMSKGANIQNISDEGFLPYEKVLEHIYTCEFTIFPSLNETFGFGQVEGALLGNKIISSNRPHVTPVLSPSASFNPESPNDIAAKIIAAITTDLPPSKLYFLDEVNNLIKLLYSN